jgi:hypothetical protein
MSNVPFLFSVADRKATSVQGVDGDVLASIEPLPAVLEMDGGGYVLSRETRMTEVKPESADEK